MLHYIKGEYTGSNEDYVLVENGGLGYKIHVSSLTESRMPPPGSRVHLYLHVFMREDHISLYGFLTEGELDYFKALISVSGIGPRVGLTLLSSLSLPELHSIIARQDAAALTRVKGVGKKSAQRLILELKDRLPPAGPAESPGTQDLSGLTEAREALLSLGYSMAEAADALAAAAAAGATAREDLIKRSLKHLAERR